MLVSHRHRFIYTKTAKTAGTSVESYFEPYCMAEGEWTSSGPREEYVSSAGIVGFRGGAIPKGCKWWNHMPAAQIKKQLGDEIWSSYLKFCVVRNPYDKAISEFYFLRKQGVLKADDRKSEAAQFEHWLASNGPAVDRDKYLIDGELCVDVVVKYEFLHRDLEQLCTRLGIPWNPELLPTFKKGIRPAEASVLSLYTEKAKEIVGEVYAFELKQFDYGFPAEEQVSAG